MFSQGKAGETEGGKWQGVGNPLPGSYVVSFAMSK